MFTEWKFKKTASYTATDSYCPENLVRRAQGNAKNILISKLGADRHLRFQNKWISTTARPLRPYSIHTTFWRNRVIYGWVIPISRLKIGGRPPHFMLGEFQSLRSLLWPPDNNAHMYQIWAKSNNPRRSYGDLNVNQKLSYRVDTAVACSLWLYNARWVAPYPVYTVYITILAVD